MTKLSGDVKEFSVLCVVDGKWVDRTWRDMEEMKCQRQKNKSRNKYEKEVVYSLCFRTIISPIWLRNVGELG